MIAAIILAGGRSTRMQGLNKLTSHIADRSLVRIVAEAATRSRVDRVIVVTGHDRTKVEAELDDLDVTFVHNPAFSEGLSTSLRTGLSALSPGIQGAVILLGDMPNVGTGLIDEMIARFKTAGPSSVIVPTSEGRRGNPVLWGRDYFNELTDVTGDKGGRDILRRLAENVVEVPVAASVFDDIDTPDDLNAERDRQGSG